LHGMYSWCGPGLLLGAKFNGGQPDCCVQIQGRHQLKIDDSTQVHRKCCPEMVEQVELAEVFISCCVVSHHVGQADVAMDIWYWLKRHQSVAFVGIQDDAVTLLRHPKKSQIFLDDLIAM
jgi:hypothetical protein